MSPIRAGGYWPRSAFRTAENSPSTSPGTRRHCTPDRCSEVHRDIPAVVRSKALAAGATQWIHDLADLVASIEQDWSIAVGRPYRDSTEAFVAQATLGDGAPAVLKLLVPRADEVARNEVTALRLANGEGCVRLLREDTARGALLLERLGRSLHELALPIAQRHEVLCSAAARGWRPAPRRGPRGMAPPPPPPPSHPPLEGAGGSPISSR